MEVGFDKEIDALMRSSGGGRTITISEFAAPHIDADTLNAFAENALPDAARKGYMTHLADCDRCRKTLSSLIGLGVPPLGGEFSREEGLLKQELKTSVPWYRSLFAIQNLAYGMGALVVLFAGFIGYIVLQNTGMSGVADVSQVADGERTGSGPMAEEPGTFAANSSRMANVSSSANANAAVASANKSGPAESASTTASNTIVGQDVAIATEQPALVLDGVDAAKPAVAPPPPAAVTAPAPKEMNAAEDKADKSKDETKLSDLKVMRQEEQMPSAGNMPNTQAGPSRNTQRDNRSSERERDLAKRSAIPAYGRAASPSKTVSGKNFSKRDNVWYDSSYSGQATTNVRRGTEDYRKLDSGLRTIAESLDGIFVVVWKSKAYRIQ